MEPSTPSWPEFPAALFTDRTSPQARDLWEGWLRAARRAGGHGPMPVLPDTDIVVRHATAREVLSDEAGFPQHLTGSFRSMARLNPALGPDFHAMLAEMEAESLINQGGERHRALRALLGRAFTARRINRVRPFIRDLAHRLAAALEPGDDYMTGFAAHVPSTTLCELIGIPEEDRARCTAWASTTAVVTKPLTLLTLDADGARATVEAREAFLDYGTALLARRRGDPHDDLVSELALAPDPGFSDRTLALNLADLLFGGNDNTQRALGLMMLVLIDHPGTWDAVAGDPALAVPVVEELLRHSPSSAGAVRRTTPTADGDFPEDRVLWASSYSANHDEAVFADEATFDPQRPNARDHLTFGHGHHHCVGASLARAELQECLRVLTSTLTCPQLSGELVIVNDGAPGPSSLPITFAHRAG